MQKKVKIIYEDKDLLVIDKPAGINSDDFPKRIHRLDKNTSGILLIAKSDKSLIFFQNQFKTKEVEKKYLALVFGNLKTNEGKIETLIGRSRKDRRKQKVYLFNEPEAKGKREAITEYKVITRFDNSTLVEITPRTGRKHQIRCHFAYLNHPIMGDKLYGFKNQPHIKELKRQFLHAYYLKIKMPNGETKEFKSELQTDLKICLQNQKPLINHS